MSSLAGETFTPTPEKIFRAIEEVMQLCRGGYSVCILINNVGIVSFRDPNGIRPFTYGKRASLTCPGSIDYMFASESVTIESNGFELAVTFGWRGLIDLYGIVAFPPMLHQTELTPAFLNMTRPDFSDGVSVYQARLNMGEKQGRA